MLIKQCSGYELEKEKKNTSEDFFNRSEVTYIEAGKEKVLSVLYVRYFDEKFNEFTTFEQDPLFEAGSRQIFFKDIVGLVCLLQNPDFRHRKRVYINSEKELASYFKDFNEKKLPEVFEAIENNGGYKVK